MNLEVLAEVVHSFVQWVDRKTEKLPYPVFFLSRDGNIFRRISKRPSEILRVSSTALWKSSIFNEGDLYHYVFRYLGIVKKSIIYDMFNIPHRKDGKEVIDASNISEFVAINIQLIIEKSFQYRKNLYQYFSRCGILNKKIIIVDVGIGGTIQYLLLKHGISSIGYYLMTNNYNSHQLDISNLERYGFLVNRRNNHALFKLFVTNTYWLEPIFMGDLTDTVIGYDSIGNPLCKKHSFTNAQFDKLVEYHQLIVNYTPKNIDHLAQTFYNWLYSTDFEEFDYWTRGKNEIRRSGTGFRPGTLLFISNANSVFSRYSELLFNHLISDTSLAYTSDSFVCGEVNLVSDSSKRLELKSLLKEKQLVDLSLNKKIDCICVNDLENSKFVITLIEDKDFVTNNDTLLKCKNKVKVWDFTGLSNFEKVKKIDMNLAELVNILKSENNVFHIENLKGMELSN